jgi:ankyrin repeat protein
MASNPEQRLPDAADLTQLKRLARELQRAFASADPAARAEVARQMPHRPAASSLTLADAQCTLARTYGFASWLRLKAHVEWMRRPPEERMEAAASTVNPVGFCNIEQLDEYAEKLDALRAMLQQQPDIARRRWGDRQWTLLHQAAWGCGLEVAELLLESGADPHARDAGGATPLSVALHFGYGRAPLARRLTQLGPEPDNLRVAAGLGRIDHARDLLRDARSPASPAASGHELWHVSYGLPEWPLPTGRQALIDDAFSCAARSEQLETMAWLLQEGADVNAAPCVATALHWAAFLGRLESVRFLLSHGADVTRREPWNDGTALTWAHVFGVELKPDTQVYVSIAELLIEHGSRASVPLLSAYGSAAQLRDALSQESIDVDQLDWHGLTGLMIAVQRGREEIAALLLERGADPDRADASGDTPRAVAQRKRLHTIVQLMR